MLKVLQVTESFGGGIIHSMSQICRGLSHEIQFHVLHGYRAETPKDYQACFPSSVNFMSWTVSKKIGFKQGLDALKELDRAICRIQPDVIHMHSSEAGEVARMLPVSNDRKVIYSPRGFSFLRRDVSCIKRQAYRTIEKVLGMCNHITVACGLGEYQEALKVSKHSYLIPNMIDLYERKTSLSLAKPLFQL